MREERCERVKGGNATQRRTSQIVDYYAKPAGKMPSCMRVNSLWQYAESCVRHVQMIIGKRCFNFRAAGCHVVIIIKLLIVIFLLVVLPPEVSICCSASSSKLLFPSLT